MTVVATSNAGTPANALSALQFAATTNASVDVGSQVGATGTFTVSLAPGTMQTTFVVNRLNAGQASTVQLAGVDTCGEWPTLVGGGPGAF